MGGASERRQWRSHRQAGVRNRQGAIPRPRTGRRTPMAVMDARRLTDSIGAVLDPIFALRRRVVRGARRVQRFGSRSGRWRLQIARERLAGLHRQASRRGRLWSAPRRWPGPRRRCNSITSASTPAKPDFFNASQATSSLLAADFAPVVGRHSARLRSAIRSVVSGHFRRSADRAVANRRDREHSMSPAKSCRLTNIGG